jgi:acetyl-CoA C-acetyltransferase
MTDIVIASAARTPVGSFNGAFTNTPAHDLGAVAIKAALQRAKVEPSEVDEVILGQVLTAGQGQNPARQAAMKAGIPQEKTAWSLNQVCGSGLRAVALGMLHVASGDTNIIVAGGQESMSLSGARILVTLLNEMHKRDAKRGLATLCIGGGMGIALAVER